MTFSDSKVSGYLQEHFVAQWESVSPVRLVKFDLGEGRSFSGTVNGEIAIYFCDSEGKVFDILPALQSPAITFKAIKDAHAFYKKHDGKIAEEAIYELHRSRMKQVAEERYDVLEKQGKAVIKNPSRIPAGYVFPETKKGEEKRDSYIRAALDDATRDLRTMSIYKVGPPPTILRSGGFSESAMTVVEPGGLGYYSWQIDRAFIRRLNLYKLTLGITQTKKETRKFSNEGLMTPGQWKSILFTDIMKQELKGGVVEYNSESLVAIQIIE